MAFVNELSQRSGSTTFQTVKGDEVEDSRLRLKAIFYNLIIREIVSGAC